MNEKEIRKLKSQTILQIVIDEFLSRGLLNDGFTKEFGCKSFDEVALKVEKLIPGN